MLKNLVIGLIGIGLFGLTSCATDNQETVLKNGAGCDTTNIGFKDIYPIIQSNCNSCHGADVYEVIGGNYSLEGYDMVKIQADRGALVGTISHNGSYPQMPRGSSKLPDCDILRISMWVNKGAQNN